MVARIAVAYLASDKLSIAQNLAYQLQLDLLDDYKPTLSKRYDYILLIKENYIGLQDTSNLRSQPFYVNFADPKFIYRLQQASLKKEALAKAIGLSPVDAPSILDATAGFGRDSVVLASLGYHVTLLEKSPLVYQLLKDGFERASAQATLATYINRLNLIQVDALDWLKTHHYDVIYLDPMFPVRKKSAKVKKAMLILQEIATLESPDTLFEMALSCAKKRIVVKRPRLSAFMQDRKPNFSISGKDCRFDVYPGQAR